MQLVYVFEAIEHGAIGVDVARAAAEAGAEVELPAKAVLGARDDEARRGGDVGELRGEVVGPDDVAVERIHAADLARRGRHEDAEAAVAGRVAIEDRRGDDRRFEEVLPAFFAVGSAPAVDLAIAATEV